MKKKSVLFLVLSNKCVNSYVVPHLLCYDLMIYDGRSWRCLRWTATRWLRPTIERNKRHYQSGQYARYQIDAVIVEDTNTADVSYAHTRSLHNVTALVHTGILQCSTDERVNDGAKQTGHTAKHNDRPLGWAQVQGVCVDRVDDDQVVCDADRNAAQETDEIK